MRNRYEIDWDKYAALARQAAAEGVVLLRNEDGTLPLREGEKTAVFERIQFDYYKSGTGSGGLVNTKYVVGILDALKEEKLILNRNVESYYQEWMKDHPFDEGPGWAQEPWSQEEAPLPEKIVRAAAEESETAIIVIGRTAGEERDVSAKKGSYLLADLEEEMLEKVCGMFRHTIVLLNVGSIIDMKWVKKYQPSAVLYVWQGGMEGGHGVADVLMGRVNPCGKLTDTIGYDISDYPSTVNFGGNNGNIYAEDIYVGYRYFETFAKDKVVYPFGYGLSYTDFEVQCTGMERRSVVGSAGTGKALPHECVENSEGQETMLRVKVTNTGAVPGKEVVQVYVSAPQGVLGKPSRSLAAFAKTRLLAPGESEKLEFLVKDGSIASYDDAGLTGHRSCYILETGRYEFYIGTDVRCAAYAGAFAVEETTVTEVCSEAMAPEQSFERMAPAGCKNRVAPAKTSLMKEHASVEELREILYTGDRGWKLERV